jgi:hypothetical protein
MDYPRYKAQRLRPPGKGAFSDFATSVLSGTVQPAKRSRRYRAGRKSAALGAKDAIEG